MKTTTDAFLAKQASTLLRPGFRVELLEQFSGKITQRVTSSQIKIDGDATDLLSAGDKILIPLADMETEHVIGSLSYASGETTINSTAFTFTSSGIAGMYVAKKRLVTADLIDGSLSTIRTNTEGASLNSSLADDVSFALDNSADKYYAFDGSGIFNSGNAFWLKIYFFLENDPTEFLYFGGLVLADGFHTQENKIVEVTACGHLKELERYPGWYNSTQLGDPVRITGVELIACAGADYEGRRSLKYNFPDGQDIGGLKINSVSGSTPIGFHVLKFQPPNLFQYDFGSWTACTAGTAGVTLTSDKGHTINIDVPTNLDLIARQDLVYVKNALSPEVDNVGRATMLFSGGKKQHVKYDFERVIRHYALGTAYYDITREVCAGDVVEIMTFQAANDVLWIMSPEPFYGIEFDLNSDIDGTFAFYYSRKFGDWGTLTVNDGTSDFTTSGVISWDPPGGWRRSNVTINSVDYEDYYVIKILCASVLTGDCRIRRALRYFRLYGGDGATLDVKCKFESFQPKSVEDEIVVVNDSAGDQYPHTWPLMQSFQIYLQNILSSSEYTAGYRTIDDLKIVQTEKVIALYGPPPKPFYTKKPTALCVDTATTPETVYVALEDEIWKVSETAGFTFIGQVDRFYKAAPAGYEEYKRVVIRKMVIDGNRYLQGIAVADYDDFYYGTTQNMRRAAVVFRSTNLTSITQQNEIQTSSYPSLVPGSRLFRVGTYSGAYENCIGQNSVTGVTAGENIAIPFRQVCLICNVPVANNSVVYDVDSLTGNTVSGSGRKYPTTFEQFYLPPGFYHVSDNYGGNGDVGALGFAFDWGQDGAICWNDGWDKWIMLEWDGSNYNLAVVDYTGSISTLFNFAAYSKQILCIATKDSGAASYVYFGIMLFDENGGSFPSDLSDAEIQYYNPSLGTMGTYFNFASDSVEANQSLAAADVKYCVPLSMVYHPDDETLYGCLFNRNDLTYHFYCYDIYMDKLYTTQTGTGFVFQDHRPIKKPVYNSDDGSVYAVVIDNRYEEETAFLISARFVRPSGTPDGSEITLNFESNIKANETDIVDLAVGNNGRLYGITGNISNYLFQYDSEFYPRFFIADTGDDNFRTILDELAEAMNMVHSIGPDRKIHFIARDSNKGEITISENGAYLLDSLKPLQPWAHRYDGVEVEWNDPVSGEKGIERYGDFGFNRRVLKIINYFIQYAQLAALLARAYYDFFATERNVIEFRSLPLWQVDNRDKLTFVHSGQFDFDAETEWIISDVELDPNNHEISIKGIEK